MATIRIPTPLRSYVSGQAEVTVSGRTVGAALNDLAAHYPALRPHIYGESGELRSFVNVFVNQNNASDLDGVDTPINDADRLMIVPSIAGGVEMTRQVDHSAIRTNQAFIIGLLLAAFVVNQVWLAALVAAVMLLGTAWPRAALFQQIYYHLLRKRLVQPDIVEDNPQPHRFAQGLGGMVLVGGLLAFALGAPVIGWALAWVVILLAAVNLFLGFCVGCFVYYWLARLSLPGFTAHPIGGAFPGARPKAH
jgi:molybdopterin converting factor small subunit